MLLKTEAVKEMYDSVEAVGKQCGIAIGFGGLFDKRYLLPIDRLPQAVKSESGRDFSAADSERLAHEGWYALLPMPHDPSNYGVPFFIPSRIGLYLDLSDRGYASAELRLFAEWEDFWIESFADLGLDYVDDDIELLSKSWQERVESANDRVNFASKEQSGAVGSLRDALGQLQEGGWDAELERARGQLNEAKTMLSCFERLRGKTLTAAQHEEIRRAAFYERVQDDQLRFHFIDSDRAKMHQGYSPFVSTRGQSWQPPEHRYQADIDFDSWYACYSFDEINWFETLRSPCLEEWALGVRLPEFILDGERVTATRPLIPSAYKRAWDDRGLDRYFEALSELDGETRCLHCRVLLAKDRNPRQRYCSDPCRNAAKQGRLRRNNPDSAFKAQSKYYQSLAHDEAKKHR